MNTLSLDLVRTHFAARCASRSPPRRGRCSSSTPTPKSEAHARGGARSRCSATALERGLDRRRGDRLAASSRRTRCGTCARSIPLAQVAEGAQHQARHRAAGLGDRRVRRRDRRRPGGGVSRRRAWSTSAISATATCTTTCRARDGAMRATFVARYENEINAHRLRRGRRRAAARSRPSTASARSSATSWSRASRRSRST